MCGPRSIAPSDVQQRLASTGITACSHSQVRRFDARTMVWTESPRDIKTHIARTYGHQMRHEITHESSDIVTATQCTRQCHQSDDVIILVQGLMHPSSEMAFLLCSTYSIMVRSGELRIIPPQQCSDQDIQVVLNLPSRLRSLFFSLLIIRSFRSLLLLLTSRYGSP